MQFVSNRFGKLEYDPSEVIRFPQGLVGFPSMTRFFMHRDAQIAPLAWLVSLDDPDLAFMVASPFQFYPEYEVNVRLPRAVRREMGEEHELSVLGVITVQQDFRESTINLLGPLVLNEATHTGWQVILEDEELSTRHLLFPQAIAEASRPAAAMAQAV